MTARLPFGMAVYPGCPIPAEPFTAAAYAASKRPTGRVTPALIAELQAEQLAAELHRKDKALVAARRDRDTWCNTAWDTMRERDQLRKQLEAQPATAVAWPWQLLAWVLAVVGWVGLAITVLEAQ